MSGVLFRAVKRGLIGGSRPWLVILAVMVGGRVVRSLGRWERSRSRWSERLEVGDRVEISTVQSWEVSE